MIENEHEKGSPTLQYLLEVKKVQEKIAGTFYSVALPHNRRAMSFVSNDNKRYIVAESLKNYKRFEKWDNEQATIDLQKTGKRVRLADNTKASLINLRVNISFNNKQPSEEEVY
jgi:hypothetical protein